MTKPIVLLDCDGVLADFTGAFLRVLNHYTGASHTDRDVTQWAIHKCDFFVELAKVHPGLQKRVYDEVARPGFCETIDPYPHARAFVDELSRVAEIFIVTSPFDTSDTWMHERQRWLKHHLGIPGSNVIHTHAKHLVRGDLFVDDKPEHVVTWGLKWGHPRAILWDAPHNRSDSSKVFRGGATEVITLASMTTPR